MINIIQTQQTTPTDTAPASTVSLPQATSTATTLPAGVADQSGDANPTSVTQLSKLSEPSFLDPSYQFELLQKQFELYACFGCCSPQSSRPSEQFDHFDYPYCGTYPSSDLSVEFEHRMRQALELQTWLAMDASAHFTFEGGPIPPEGSDQSFGTAPESYRTSLLQIQLHNIMKKRNALLNLQSVLVSRLRAHAGLTGAVFESARLAMPTDASTTELPEECLRLMAKASINSPIKMNSLGLYRVLAERMQAQERELFAVNLEILRDEMHAARLEFYLQVGQFLQGQAKTVLGIGNGHPGNNAQFLEQDDVRYQSLREVLDEPIFTSWPAPEQPDIDDFMWRPEPL